MDINPEDKISYTTQYQKAFQKYVDNQYCVNHRRMSVIKPENVLHRNIFPSAKASGFGQFCFDPYDLSSNDDEY